MFKRFTCFNNREFEITEFGSCVFFQFLLMSDWQCDAYKWDIYPYFNLKRRYLIIGMKTILIAIKVLNYREKVIQANITTIFDKYVVSKNVAWIETYQ